MRQYSSSYIFNEQTPSGQPLLLGSLKRRKLGGSRTSQHVNNESGVGAWAGSAGATAGCPGSGPPTTTLSLCPPPLPPLIPHRRLVPPSLASLQQSQKPLFSELPALWGFSLAGSPALGNLRSDARRGSGHPASLPLGSARSWLSGWVGTALCKGNRGKVGARVSL